MFAELELQCCGEMWTAELWIHGGDIIGLTLAVSPHTWCRPAAPRRDQEMYELFRHIKLSANCCNHTPPASIEVCRGETRSWSCYLCWFVYLGVEYSSPPASNLLNLRSPTIGEIVAGSREVWKPNICRKCPGCFAAVV